MVYVYSALAYAVEEHVPQAFLSDGSTDGLKHAGKISDRGIWTVRQSEDTFGGE
jgi:hypothetical protein